MQFYNVARGSTAEVRSLLYVIEDNFPQRASQSIVLRDEIVGDLRVCVKLTCRAVAAKAEDLKVKTALSLALPPSIER